MNNILLTKLQNELWYTVRRYYVDDFFLSNVTIFKRDSFILDVGGKKNKKRGVFDVEKYNLKVEYSNIEKTAEPDYLCDATAIPVAENTYDGIILSEVLEHVEYPLDVLKEIYRILKPEGILLLCTPFMIHVHPDPFDFARYTDYWYKKKLADIGYEVIQIVKQGHLFSVAGNLLKLFAYELSKSGKPSNKYLRKLFHKFVSIMVSKFISWDGLKFIIENKFLSDNTTGYGIIAKKVKK